MNRTCKHSLLAAALATLLSLGGSHALADSLVTTDGDMFTGAVQKTETGYTVQTADGPVDIAADKVKKILLDHPQAPPTPAAVTPAPVAATPAAPAVRDPAMLKALLGQGEAAMGIGEYLDARDAFTDAMALDPKNAVAGRGLGFSYLKLGKAMKALKPLEVAALGQTALDRSLTMALSEALVASHNASRAVKILTAYLNAHPTPLDEPVINALGIALSQVERSATKNTVYADGVKLYLKLNDQLDAAATDKKRWGIEWLSADEVNKRKQDRTEAQQASDAAWEKLQTENSAVTSAQNALAQAQNSNSRRVKKDQEIRDAQDKLNNATTAQEDAQMAYDKAGKILAALPSPTFPADIPLDGVELSLNPNPTVASAVTPAQTPAVTPTPATPAVANATPTPDPAPAPVKKHPKPDPVAGNTDNTDPTPAPAPVAAAPKHSTRYAVGFAIAPDVLVTAASAVEDATDIQITTSDGKTMSATVLRAHHSDGLALLKVDGGKLPCLMLASAADAGGAISCFSYPEVDLFNPSPKEMTAAAGDQTSTWTVRFDTSPRLPGGPLMQANAVVGVELGDRDCDVNAVPAATLKTLLSLTQDSANATQAPADPKTAVVQVMAER